VESWQYDKSPECRSKHYRHAVCVYGVEDFVWLASHPKLMANKVGEGTLVIIHLQMMPSFDYGAVDCMHELIFNRTHIRTNDHIWNLKLYKNQPYANSQNAVPRVHLTGDGTMSLPGTISQTSSESSPQFCSKLQLWPVMRLLLSHDDYFH
ncbi:hypothetical protein OSTOST_01251, partial [Ostertagia ostertagi]